MVAIWNPFWIGGITIPVEELMLISTLAPGEDPHEHLIVANQLKFLKQEITFITTYSTK